MVTILWMVCVFVQKEFFSTLHLGNRNLQENVFNIFWDI